MAVITRLGNQPETLSAQCQNCWLQTFSGKTEFCGAVSSGSANRQKKVYSKGENLIRSGDPAKGVFCIASGIAKVSRRGKESTEFIPWVARPGDILGLNAIISDEAFSFSASAISPITACFIPADVLQQLLLRDPQAFMKLLKRVSDSLTLLEDRIASLSTRKKRELLAEVLISITTPAKEESKSATLIQCSVKDLASLTGTSKNYMNKLLADFSEKEIISVRNRNVIIRNREALSSIATGN